MFSNDNQELNDNISITDFLTVDVLFQTLFTRPKEIYKLFYNQIICCLSIIASLILCTSYLLLTNYDSTLIFNQKTYSHPSKIKHNEIKEYQPYSSIYDNFPYNIMQYKQKQQLLLYFQMYNFVNNLTTLNYFGKWDNLNYESNHFENKKGDIEIEFKKISNVENTNYTGMKFKMIFLLKDNKYIDKYIKGRVILNVNNEYMLNLDDILHRKNNVMNLNEHNIISLINYNESVMFYSCSFFGSCNKIIINETLVNVTFINKPKTIKESFKYKISSQFSEIIISFQNNNNQLSLNANSTININKQFFLNVNNYSFMISILTIIEIYYAIDFLFQIKNYKIKSQSVNVFASLNSLITKSFLSIIHFYLAITSRNDTISLSFGIISLIYFIFLSFIEVRTFYYIFQLKYDSLYETNPSLFKKKLYLFSGIFYIIVIVCLICSKEILTNFVCYLLFYVSTWAVQIIHSIWVGTRPIMSKGYIVSVSLNKVFMVIYIKGYDNNLFEFKPNYKNILILVFVIICEVVIILLQKYYGSRIIVPSFLRKYSYNYYYDDYSDKCHVVKHKECVICLCLMKEEKVLANKNGKNKLIKVVEYLQKIFEKKCFMITPCNHVFHSFCLEKWLEVKNECPYCKQTIPELE